MTDEQRTFDTTLREAFNQGVIFGARYPEADAIPPAEQEIQFRAWRDSLAGEFWTPQMWLQARIDAGLVLREGVPRILDRRPDLATRMGYVGGHYG